MKKDSFHTKSNGFPRRKRSGIIAREPSAGKIAAVICARIHEIFMRPRRITRVSRCHTANDGGGSMATSKVEICGVDTATLPVLTNERMRELFPLVHGGDRAAREEFIRGNLRLVLSVVQRFNNRGENVDDLFQVGCIGLIKALDHFDVTQNVKFSTYAVPMIIGEIRRYLRDNNPIRVSRSLRDMAYKALQARDRLVISLNREPAIEEIARELGVPQEDVVFALEAIQDPISLFEPVYNDGGDAIYIMDQVRDEKHQDDSWLERIAIKEAMKRLNDREKRILRLRFFEGRTQMEVAGEIGISQAQVSRLEKNALLHMRKYVACQ